MMCGNQEILWLLWTIRAVSAITLTISPPIVVHGTDLPAKTTFECANITADNILIRAIELSKLSDTGNEQVFARVNLSAAGPEFVPDTAQITLKKPTAAVVSGGINVQTPTRSNLKVEFQTNEMTCEDAGTYTCTLMYNRDDYSSSKGEHSQTFGVYAKPSNLTIAAIKDGIIRLSTIDSPFQMKVGENITFRCSGQMGNDNFTSLWWRMTSPETWARNQSATISPDTGTATLQLCSYSWTATMSYTAAIEDSNRTNLPAFMCSATFQPPGHPLYTVDSDASFYISVLRQKQTCGHPGYLTQDNGTIDSHAGFATNQTYGNVLNCTWTILAPVGMFIQLTAESFDLEQHPLCYYDYLAIYEGDGTTGEILGKYCEPNMPAVSSTQNIMTLNFVTDGAKPGKGFRMQYTFANVSLLRQKMTCGHPGYLTQDNVIIDSHVGFATNQDYGNNLNCTWTILAPVGMFIQLTAESFDLEQHPLCYYDYLDIHDGDGTAAASLGKFCGSNMPAVSSTQNIMTLNFVTDGVMHGKGFRLQYTFANVSLRITTCGHMGYLTQPGGLIDSHAGVCSGIEYGKLDCKWKIKAPAGKYVLITPKAFELEDRAFFRCDYDYLEIFDGDGLDVPSLGKFCGTTILPIQSTQNVLTLHFVTDAVTHQRGFRLSYNFTSTYKPTCAGNKWSCNNTKCVNLTGLCDGEDDCGDHSDEDPQYCASVTFPGGCMYSNMHTLSCVTCEPYHEKTNNLPKVSTGSPCAAHAL